METKNNMMEEIYSEKDIFRFCLEQKENFTHDFSELFRTHDFKRIYLSGSGSPSHISLILKYAITNLLGIETTYSYPMLFNNHEGLNVGNKYKPEEMLLICPAESGHSKGAVITARNARAAGIPVICTTLIPDGVLGRECDVVIKKPSGEEKALPSTKGHSTGIFLLLLCIVETAFSLGRISKAEYQEYMDDFSRLTDSSYEAAIRTEKWFAAHQKLMMNAPFYRLIAYGANYGTVLEGALKFIETHQKLTVAYELEEFLHGPIRTVKNGDVIFLICAEDGGEKERMLQLHSVLKKMTDNCILICSENERESDELSLTIPAVNKEFLNTVEYIVPLQVLASKIGEHLGFDATEGMNTWAKKAMDPVFSD